jgi:AcrR family transcriptional regulator
MGDPAMDLTPRQRERRQAILEAARDVFLEHGFEGSNLDQVIARCGGSKRTIYAYFGNKSELFGAVVRECSEELFADLPAAPDAGTDLAASLDAVGKRYLVLLTRGVPLSLFRTVVSEGPRFPELGRIFYERGPARAIDRIAGLLAAAEPGARLPADERRAFAAHFLGLLRDDDVHLQRLLGLRGVPSDAEIDAVVARAVAIFMAGLEQAAAAR